MPKQYFVYMLMSKNRMALYTGVTNNLERRIVEHYRAAVIKHDRKAFMAKYNCYYCIFFEVFYSPGQAIAREKEIKGWRREKKLLLAEETNYGLHFLNDSILGAGWEKKYLE